MLIAIALEVEVPDDLDPLTITFGEPGEVDLILNINDGSFLESVPVIRCDVHPDPTVLFPRPGRDVDV
jgi:hypothetical protein